MAYPREHQKSPTEVYAYLWEASESYRYLCLAFPSHNDRQVFIQTLEKPREVTCLEAEEVIYHVADVVPGPEWYRRRPCLGGCAIHCLLDPATGYWVERVP